MWQLNFQRIYRNSKNHSVTVSLTITSLILLFTNYGCVKQAQKEVQLEIQNIKSENSQNVYKISGSTNLPEASRITVEAVRYLRPLEGQEEESLLRSNADPKRSILARQVVQVKQGKWQTDLHLWQVARDGSFQEVWQANKSQFKLVPESGVKFIATFDPASQWQQSDQKNPETPALQNQPLEGKLVRFTNQGEQYVQASQTLLIPLPEGKTTPPRPQAGDINDGWGNRYQIPPKSVVSQANLLPSATARTTNASLASSEFLR
jgi:hypothetical protein